MITLTRRCRSTHREVIGEGRRNNERTPLWGKRGRSDFKHGLPLSAKIEACGSRLIVRAGATPIPIGRRGVAEY